MMITVASFEIASNISQDSYGLVFGINTFLALAFQVSSNFQFSKLESQQNFHRLFENKTTFTFQT